MIYTDMTKHAIRISFEAHKNQKDKSDLPYIYHPLHVAEQMNDEITTTVALLHDVVEDNQEYTFEYLEREGFPKDVLDAVKLLTHDESIDYMDYVRAIASNPVAKTVKLADLAHNSDLTRLNIVTQKDIERVNKYKKAIKILKG